MRKLWMIALCIGVFIFQQSISSAGVSPQDSVKAYNKAKEAVSLINSGEYNKAIDLLDEAIKIDPNQVIYPYEKALALYKKTEFDKVVELLSELIEHPNVTDRVYQFLGNAYDSMGLPDTALVIYKQGLEKFPNSGRLYCEIGVTETGLKHNPQAVRSWESGVEVDPLYDLNYFYLAQYHVLLKEYLWSLLYSEMYLLLSNNLQRLQTVSTAAFNTWDIALFDRKNDTVICKFTRYEYLVNDLAEHDNVPFPIYYQHIMKIAFDEVLPNTTRKVDLPDLYLLQKSFIKQWYSSNLDKRYPNILFDLHKKMIDAGVFKAYLYWMYKDGSRQTFNKWLNDNQEKHNKMLVWLRDNYPKFDKENMIHREMYD